MLVSSTAGLLRNSTRQPMGVAAATSQRSTMVLSTLHQRGVAPQRIQHAEQRSLPLAAPRSAVVAAAAAGGAAAAKPFTNKNKYEVPPALKAAFMATWMEREAIMRKFPGFKGVQYTDVAPDTIAVSSSWASIPEWEAFDLSDEAKRIHFPTGVFQYNPPKGEGFPECFVPFKDQFEIVWAKY